MWHLKETSGTTVAESTSNPNDGTKNAPTEPNPATGQIAGGQSFDNVDDRIDAGSDASLDNVYTATWSAWINPTTVGAEDSIAYKERTGLTIIDGPGFGVGDGGGSIRLYLFYDGSIDWVSSSVDNAIQTGVWQHVVGTWDGTNAIKLYRNGSEVSYGIQQVGALVADDSAATFTIGERLAADVPFDGLIDEVRLSNVIRSADWIKTEYNNQSSPSTFFTVGDEMTLAPRQGVAFRLRLLLHIGTSTLAQSGENFKLQFVDRGSGTCAAPSGGTPATYTDVTATTAIAFYDNASVSDGATLTANANDPTHGGHTIVNQTYEEANNFTNSVAAIAAGQDGKWDFALVDRSASSSTTFCFRGVKSDGTALNTYSAYPAIVTQSALRMEGLKFDGTLFGQSAVAWCNTASPSCNTNWKSRRKITFDNSASSENLTNFPVLITLDPSRIDYTKTQNSGQDLRFIDSDGTALAHEIEKWDEAGTSYVWVKVPQVDAASITDHIWLYYNNASAADGQSAASVWSNSYVGVWHLKEDPTGTEPTMKDSTSNANHGTADTGLTSADQVTGQVDGGLDFDGTTTDKVTVGDHNSLDLTNSGAIVAWVNVRSFPVDGYG